MQKQINRHLFLHGEIEQENILDLIKQIKEINEYDDAYSEQIIDAVMELQQLGVIDVDYVLEPKREPIVLEINSGGGLVSSGFALISAIENSATPIIGYVTGECCSMAITILASCHYRLGTRYARFMIHEISGGYIGKIGEMKSYMTEQMEILAEQYADVLVEYTDMEKQEIIDIFNKNIDYWFNPEKAKEYGLLDAIDTEDISQKDILEKIYDGGEFEPESKSVNVKEKDMEIDIPIEFLNDDSKDIIVNEDGLDEE